MLDHGALDHANISEAHAHRHAMRHSAAHVMADAVLKLFPEAKMGIGPPTQDGFYYDFDVSRPFTPEDLERIESLMREAMSGRFPFEREELSRQQAQDLFADQPYKLELIEGLDDSAVISIYRHNGFVDLCQGPHVGNTAEIPAMKLLSVAGAYWRGDEKRPMLQRIYGTAFESEDELADHLAQVWRKRSAATTAPWGGNLGLYTIHDEIGPGLVVWHPKGGRVRSLIEDYWKDLHYRRGYDVVYSPHIGRSTLWQTSGHLDFYREGMFSAVEVDEQEYYLKPMNCPFHITIYRSALRSYRELPLRFAELGTVYRYERSGVLHGLMRVRGFTQDDAHIFCRPEQVEDEVGGVLELTFELMEAFGFSDYSIALSTRPEKYVGDLEMWEHATNSLQGALEARVCPSPWTKAAAHSTAPRLTSTSPTPWAAPGSAPPSSSTSTCRSASTSHTRTTREAAAAPTWSIAPSSAPWSGSWASLSSITAAPSRSGWPRCRQWSSPSPTATRNTLRASCPSSVRSRLPRRGGQPQRAHEPERSVPPNCRRCLICWSSATARRRLARWPSAAAMAETWARCRSA